MAEESFVAQTPNWWDLHPPTSFSSSSWNPTSFNHDDHISGRPTDDRLMGDNLSDNHIWRHVSLSVGENREMHNDEDIGDNLLCSSSLEFTNSPSFNNVNHSTGPEKPDGNWSPDTLNLSRYFKNHSFGNYELENELQEMDPFNDTRSLNLNPMKTHGKRKRILDDSSRTILKKTKQESDSTINKAPKVKLADKITALQQIVSPFGKTDTSSVLYEAIGYIKFLQEQVQMLSNPYMKTNSHKGPWEWKIKGDPKHELRSRGLCLVPISFTPRIYQENGGPEYWAPAFRGCLYR